MRSLSPELESLQASGRQEYHSGLNSRHTAAWGLGGLDTVNPSGTPLECQARSASGRSRYCKSLRNSFGVPGQIWKSEETHCYFSFFFIFFIFFILVQNEKMKNVSPGPEGLQASGHQE